MRRLLLVLVFMTTAPALFGAPGDCHICRGTINPFTIRCDYPDNNDWGNLDCQIRTEGTLTTCQGYGYECYYTESDGDPDNCGPGTGVDCEQQDNCGGACSPIIIDMDGDGYSLTNAAHGVSFDIDGDGAADRISWTSGGDDDSFLWLDNNGNGIVDSGKELFGDAVYDNGFDKLKNLDATSNGGNGDGMISAADLIWPALRLWRDSNHDGISQAAEISTMAASRYTAIGVMFTMVGKRDQHGNRFRYKGRIYAADVPGGAERVYDIIFTRAGS